MEETEKKDESKTEEEVKPEATAPDKQEGDKPKEPNFIDDTNLASKRMEEANKERLKILEEEKRLWSEQKLAGVSGSATQQKKEVSEDQKKVNNASEFFKDTALGDAIKKTNE